MRVVQRLTLTLAASGVLSCGGRSPLVDRGNGLDGGEAVDGGQPLPPATASCVVGWWFAGGGSCFCNLLKSPPPECVYSDCELLGYYGFQPNQTLSNGQISLSPSHQQFSRFQGEDDLAWAIVDGGFIATYYDFGDGGLLATGRPQAGTCQGDQLRIGLEPLNRQSPPISTALQAAYEDGGWQAVQY